MSCRDADVDHLRGLTVTATGGIANSTTVEVNLCPGARVYSLTFFLNSAAEVIPGFGCTLELQDSEYIVPMNGLRQNVYSVDLPGLAWPAFARFTVVAGTTVTLLISYGNCA